jgi:hypothetical protein
MVEIKHPLEKGDYLIFIQSFVSHRLARERFGGIIIDTFP